MLDDFLVRAALAGVGVALAAGPLGCFVLCTACCAAGVESGERGEDLKP